MQFPNKDFNAKLLLHKQIKTDQNVNAEVAHIIPHRTECQKIYTLTLWSSVKYHTQPVSQIYITSSQSLVT